MTIKKVEFIDKKDLENSLLSAMLSTAIYKEDSWSFSKLNEDEIANEVYENSLKKQNNDVLNRAFFIKEYTKPITPKQINMTSHGKANVENNKYEWQFSEDGIYRCTDLATCVVLESNINNKKVLHLVFRGTEPKSGDNFFENTKNMLIGYFLKTYPHIGVHLKYFNPLLNNLMDYARNPKNGIDEIHVAGHSLGGAMVQEFLRKYSNQSDSITQKIKGFSFGSPGSEKESKIFYSAIKKTLSFINPFKINNEDDSYRKNYDSRHISFVNPKDPVPILGNLLYKKNGIIVKTNDKKMNSLWSLPALSQHSMTKYFDTILNNLKDLVSSTGEKSLLLSKYNDAILETRRARTKYLVNKVEGKLDNIKVFANELIESQIRIKL